MAGSAYHQYKPKSVNLTPQYYMECLEQSSSFNIRLCMDRKSRMPFIDSQTGVAQNPCNLWMSYRFRQRGSNKAQVYSYPARRWKRKKKSFLLSDYGVAKPADIETGEAERILIKEPPRFQRNSFVHAERIVIKEQPRLQRNILMHSDMHQISAVENPAVVKEVPVPDTSIKDIDETSKEQWYDEYDEIEDPPDAGEIDERNSDSSDYEDTYIKRKKKKKQKTPSRGGGRKKEKVPHSEDYEEKEKPYGCDICGARYKTRPGLTYHLTHSHNNQTAEEEEEIGPAPSPKIPTQTSTNGKSRSSNKSKGNNPNNYCDFCLGDEHENKKTGQKEILVSCADCGRSGHPTCLQFTANMIISVKKYPWQCIECKSCGLCGTSDNDDQLLFCDDCDRGYHMYCLNPPLSEPPEGSWSCHLCIVEFYGGKKPEGMQ